MWFVKVSTVVSCCWLLLVVVVSLGELEKYFDGNGFEALKLILGTRKQYFYESLQIMRNVLMLNIKGQSLYGYAMLLYKV
ncbi:hypothetical protein BDV41DRAFT_510194 [Aspergillus transmontanensis]|uniref:Uncharacterized protein n=1 Tax=Aspergillus transmontanensis TaxID=1034304 RepID=A0A5N6VJI6_9EURO|nr:hypothetical protein BDV41DRAFT_510194 [Aspergillus transmontanensis]